MEGTREGGRGGIKKRKRVVKKKGAGNPKCEKQKIAEEMRDPNNKRKVDSFSAVKGFVTPGGKSKREGENCRQQSLSCLL